MLTGICSAAVPLLVTDQMPVPEPVYCVALTAEQEVHCGTTKLAVLGPGVGVTGPNAVDVLEPPEDEVIPFGSPGVAGSIDETVLLSPPPPPHAPIPADRTSTTAHFPNPPNFIVRFMCLSRNLVCTLAFRPSRRRQAFLSHT
jgi:hypothetical protein